MAEDVIRGKLGVPKTLNRYGYCWGNPFSFIDPSGMVSEQEAQSIITENAQFIFDAAEKMNMMTTGMNGIEKMSDNYLDFIKKLGKYPSNYFNGAAHGVRTHA